jgi:serine phosphatase RsbU (regulator of sigma subunit)
VHEGGHDDGRRLLWVPLIDGAERLGVCRVVLPAHMNSTDPVLAEHCLAVSALVAHLLASKIVQGDELAVARRSRPMSVAGELLWQLLPPLTVGGRGLALAAVLEPAYDVSGDAFDYAVATSHADFAIFDSSGHDLSAGLTTSVTLAASRSARREGHGLPGIARRIDAALTEQFSDHRFVTGVLARLDLESGRLRYLVAGHPPPVLLRRGRAVRTLDAVLRMPFGRVASMIPQPDDLGEEFLEPGDRILLHSDGVVEARDETGEEFGVDRLVELAEHAAAAQLPAPETLRRLAHAVREHRTGELRDDATLMLVEWSGSAAERLLARLADNGRGR